MNEQFEAYTTAKVGEQYPTHWEPLRGSSDPDGEQVQVWVCGHSHLTYNAAGECCNREYRRMVGPNNSDVAWINVRRIGKPLWDY